MKIEIHSKPIQEDFITLEMGKRAFLHPSLKAIENYDCKLVYSLDHKFFIVDYKKVDGTYTKTLMTPSIEFMIEILFE